MQQPLIQYELRMVLSGLKRKSVTAILISSVIYIISAFLHLALLRETEY